LDLVEKDCFGPDRFVILPNLKELELDGLPYTLEEVHLGVFVHGEEGETGVVEDEESEEEAVQERHPVHSRKPSQPGILNILQTEVVAGDTDVDRLG